MTDSFKVLLEALDKGYDIIQLLIGEKVEDRAKARDFEAAGRKAEDAGRDTTDWLIWAVPAIQEVLAEHHPQECRSGYDCDPGTEMCPIWGDEQEWREHVAPIIAKRIGCDPSRAIAALRNFQTG